MNSENGAMPKRRVGTRLVRAGMLALLFPVVWAETAKPKVEAGPLCHWSWRAAGHDANGGWSPRVAIQTIRRLYEHGIYFVEQPVPALDAAWMADVRSQVQVPIMADESVNTLQDAMALVRARAADVLSVYVGKGGGVGPARKITAVAEGAGL